MPRLQFLSGRQLGQPDVLRNLHSPSGLIQFDLTKSAELSGIEALYPLLGVEGGSSFTLVKTTPSRLNADLNHYKYQQYHHGLKVVGGGYTVSALTNEPGDPCAQAYLLAPNIYSGINVSTSPSVLSSQLGEYCSLMGQLNPNLQSP